MESLIQLELFSHVTLGPLWLQCMVASDRDVPISSVSNQLHRSYLQISLQELQGLGVQTSVQHRGNLRQNEHKGATFAQFSFWKNFGTQ